MPRAYEVCPFVDKIYGSSCGTRGVRVKQVVGRKRLGSGIIWCSVARCSLATYPRWGTRVTGRGSLGVRGVYLSLCTYKTNMRSRDRDIVNDQIQVEFKGRYEGSKEAHGGCVRSTWVLQTQERKLPRQVSVVQTATATY
ncbi:hypothetical protein B0H11DRAFT_1921697 [Mycena galericulata]|nr:hypothetical protein B0H11DRAFT_1921697 [Mycena galericulata]